MSKNLTACKNCNGKGYNSTIGKDFGRNKMSIVRLKCPRCKGSGVVPATSKFELQTFDKNKLHKKEFGTIKNKNFNFDVQKAK